MSRDVAGEYPLFQFYGFAKIHLHVLAKIPATGIQNGAGLVKT